MKLTLQNRLTIIMVGFSVLFIMVFSSLQLWNHKRRADRFLQYKIKLSSYLVKISLERIVGKDDLGLEAQDRATETLISLVRAGIIENVMLVDGEGNVFIKRGDIYYAAEDGLYLDRLKTANRDTMPRITKQGVITLIRINDNLFAKIVFPLTPVAQAISEVSIPIIFTIAIVVAVNFAIATILSLAIVKPIDVLYEATKTVASGNLERIVTITTGDEIEELGHNFNFMTKELRKMKARAENANPLTKLPGNIAIQDEVERRINQGEKFVVIYCDLDNFKAFNDKYGVDRGDEAIKLTAAVFKKAVKAQGEASDFVGHEGGDDFLLVTTPQRAQGIADSITKQFDGEARRLYSDEDLKNGYIEAHARHTNEVMRFPIMTISLAGVTNETRDIKSYAQVTNIAAEVKKKAKKISGSVFVLDRRGQ